jgi:hypothetical protein
MNKHESTTIAAETATREQDQFEVHEGRADDLEVVEFENAPLTDINFGF